MNLPCASHPVQMTGEGVLELVPGHCPDLHSETIKNMLHNQHTKIRLHSLYPMHQETPPEETDNKIILVHRILWKKLDIRERTGGNWCWVTATLRWDVCCQDERYKQCYPLHKTIALIFTGKSSTTTMNRMLPWPTCHRMLSPWICHHQSSGHFVRCLCAPWTQCSLLYYNKGMQ